jgi:hypothetical protein
LLFCRLIISSVAHGKAMRIIVQIPWFLSHISTPLSRGTDLVVKLVECKESKKQWIIVMNAR